MKNKIVLIFSFLLIFIPISCSLDPVLADEDSTEINTTGDLRHLIDGAYAAMTSSSYYGRNYIIVGEVMADNVYANGNSGRFSEYSKMQLLSTSNYIDGLFRSPYGAVANPNMVIRTDLSEVEGNEADKDHILGEAYAVRALAHFDLLRFFGQQYNSEGNGLGISYITEFKGENYNAIQRATVEENKSQLYDDIENAIKFLQLGEESQYEKDKERITLDAAYAIKSRMGVYFKDYDFALEGSSMIVDNYTITQAAHLAQYWAQSSPGEASIFELYQSDTDNAGLSSLGYIFRSTSYGDIQVFNNTIADADFDKEDVRISSQMIGKDLKGQLKNLGKYPDTEKGTDNIKVLRIEEVILNHAESLLNGSASNATTALTYLNKIPQHRNAATYSVATMDNILKERRKEFIFEGFRFFDLQRSGKDIKDMGEAVNNHGLVPAGDGKYSLPIPRQELDVNSNAVQNPGYDD